MAEEGFERITPVDINNKKFGLAFRGYNEDEVDEFLDRMEKNFEVLYVENRELKEKLALKEQEIFLLRNSLKEGEVIPIKPDAYVTVSSKIKPSTLEGIEKTGREIIERAKSEADEIIKQAKYESEAMKSHWAEKLREIELKRMEIKDNRSDPKELASLEKMEENFFLHIENFLQEQLEMVRNKRSKTQKKSEFPEESSSLEKEIEWPPSRYTEVYPEQSEEIPRLRSSKEEENE